MTNKLNPTSLDNYAALGRAGYVVTSPRDGLTNLNNIAATKESLERFERWNALKPEFRIVEFAEGGAMVRTFTVSEWLVDVYQPAHDAGELVKPPNFLDAPLPSWFS